MDRYAYLLLGLSLLVLCGLIAMMRPDLRRTLLHAGIFGALAGVISQEWYLRDYWRPHFTLAAGFLRLEDLLFGFAIAGMGVAIYPFLWKKRTVPKSFPPRYRDFFLMGLGCIAALLIFTDLMRINSIFVSAAFFLACAAYMAAKRPDLLRASFLSGLVCMILIIPIYIVLFGFLVPKYLERYWFLYGTQLGLVILPGVPATELLWYFAWGTAAGALPAFASGRTFSAYAS